MRNFEKLARNMNEEEDYYRMYRIFFPFHGSCVFTRRATGITKGKEERR